MTTLSRSHAACGIKYGLPVAMALALALLGWFYLWLKAPMPIDEMSRLVLNTKAAVLAEGQNSSRESTPVCASGLGVPVEGPCPASNPLIEAAQLGDASQVELLLARRPNRKARNEAVFVAAQSLGLFLPSTPGEKVDDPGLAYARVVRLLLGHGATLEARDESGQTPLIAAARHGETEVVKLLLKKGAKVEARNTGGETALIAAACMCPIIDQPETYDSIRLLLEKGAAIEATDKEGGTALMNAAAWGRDDNAKLLLDKGPESKPRIIGATPRSTSRHPVACQRRSKIPQ